MRDPKNWLQPTAIYTYLYDSIWFISSYRATHIYTYIYIYIYTIPAVGGNSPLRMAPVLLMSNCRTMKQRPKPRVTRLESDRMTCPNFLGVWWVMFHLGDFSLGCCCGFYDAWFWSPSPLPTPGVAEKTPSAIGRRGEKAEVGHSWFWALSFGLFCKRSRRVNIM